jgi:hypothetical protein
MLQLGNVPGIEMEFVSHAAEVDSLAALARYPPGIARNSVMLDLRLLFATAHYMGISAHLYRSGRSGWNS